MASKDWTVQISRELDSFVKEENEVMFQCMSKTMKRAKKDVVNESPTGPKGYRRGWTIRNKREKYGCDSVIYNRTHPQLTHLLERPHMIKNQYGEYGRTGPGHGQVVHIGPAQENVEKYFMEAYLETHEEV